MKTGIIISYLLHCVGATEFVLMWIFTNDQIFTYAATMYAVKAVTVKVIPFECDEKASFSVTNTYNFNESTPLRYTFVDSEPTNGGIYNCLKVDSPSEFDMVISVTSCTTVLDTLRPIEKSLWSTEYLLTITVYHTDIFVYSEEKDFRVHVLISFGKRTTDLTGEKLDGQRIIQHLEKWKGFRISLRNMTLKDYVYLGAWVNAEKPVAVMLLVCKEYSCYSAEQLWPCETLGKQYHAGELIKSTILMTRSNEDIASQTYLRVDDVTETNITAPFAGAVYQEDVKYSIKAHTYIAKFTIGGNVYFSKTAFTQLMPVSTYTNFYILMYPTLEFPEIKHFVSVIVKNGNFSSLLLDGENITETVTFADVQPKRDNYVVTSFEVTLSNRYLSAPVGVDFGCIIYGARAKGEIPLYAHPARSPSDIFKQITLNDTIAYDPRSAQIPTALESPICKIPTTPRPVRGCVETDSPELVLIDIPQEFKLLRLVLFLPISPLPWKLDITCIKNLKRVCKYRIEEIRQGKYFLDVDTEVDYVEILSYKTEMRLCDIQIYGEIKSVAEDTSHQVDTTEKFYTTWWFILLCCLAALVVLVIILLIYKGFCC
ncbi:uncharacterized protein LOC131936370 isoform X3 [Physella acuta]|uniref:uncharacterized protein LOC131936370 isoform X3 n=1 Tax=Physella acuta TaxID=109671 RepID=UPI0027DD6035|nr:uncharacterized protein LOC131936370 isoform X3 [Physella acuta]